MTVRVRFAPSPTGLLHVGNARTALVNWLYARHQHGGRVLLRIEDTDPLRSEPSLAAAIRTDLEWLGLRWDEGPFHQSQARDQHRAAAERLLESGRAYRCFCSTADLETERRRQEAARRPPRYSGRCREMTPEQAKGRERAGEWPTVRLRMPARAIAVDDLVHGRIVFDGSDFDDFILLRADGSPSYHLAVVVDDHRMGITHVIRGEDHLPNTPRHIALAEALGHAPPRFAHLPLVGGSDGGPLSKRDGGLTVASLRAAGLLPEAVVNYLALLGWSPPPGAPEVMSLDDMATHFALERVSRGAARFDGQRLHWFNEQHLRRSDAGRLSDLLGLAAGDDMGRRAVEVLRGEVTSLADITRVLASLSREPGSRGLALAAPDREAMEELDELLSEPLRDVDHARRLLDGLVATSPGRSKRAIMRAVREALTGSAEGPPVAMLLWIVGADVARRRLVCFLGTCASRYPDPS